MEELYRPRKNWEYATRKDLNEVFVKNRIYSKPKSEDDNLIKAFNFFIKKDLTDNNNIDKDNTNNDNYDNYDNNEENIYDMKKFLKKFLR